MRYHQIFSCAVMCSLLVGCYAAPSQTTHNSAEVATFIHVDPAAAKSKPATGKGPDIVAERDYRNDSGFWQNGNESDSMDEMQTIQAAAEKGDPESEYTMGKAYLDGRGVAVDQQQGLQWLIKAGNHGQVDAQLKLGRMYLEGSDGVIHQPTVSEEWYGKAARQGNPEGEFYYGHLLGWNHADYVDLKKWQLKAAQQGLPEAQHAIGVMCQSGEYNTKIDYNVAAQWYRKSANQGVVDSQIMLAFMYEFGEGFPKSQVEAVKWYRKAAEQGNGNAIRWLKSHKIAGASQYQEKSAEHTSINCGSLASLMENPAAKPEGGCTYSNDADGRIVVDQVVTGGLLASIRRDVPVATDRMIHIISTSKYGSNLVDNSTLPPGKFFWIDNYTYQSAIGQRTVYSFAAE